MPFSHCPLVSSSSRLWHHWAQTRSSLPKMSLIRRCSMSIQPAPIDPVPDATIHVARAAFPKGNPYLTLRDQLGVIFQDDAELISTPQRVSPAYRRGVWLG